MQVQNSKMISPLSCTGATCIESEWRANGVCTGIVCGTLPNNKPVEQPGKYHGLGVKEPSLFEVKEAVDIKAFWGMLLKRKGLTCPLTCPTFPRRLWLNPSFKQHLLRVLTFKGRQLWQHWDRLPSSCLTFKGFFQISLNSHRNRS